jgi:hypothetical protein
VFFYDIAQIEHTEKPTPIKAGIEGDNIYRVQYAPNKDVLLVETQDPNNLNTAIYNVENLNNIEPIGATSPQNRQRKPRNMKCPAYMQTVHERSYYGRWIISPSNKFMMNHRVIFDCVWWTDPRIARNERYSAFSWNTQHIDKSSYSISYDDKATNSDMFHRNYITRWYGGPRGNIWSYVEYKILAVYDYFFANNDNSALAIISKEQIRWSQSANNRYLYFKKIAYDKIHNPRAVIRKQQRIIRNRIFDLAHSGLFNHDSSKLVIFSDNRMQVYNINLPKGAQPKTTKTPETKSTEAERKSTEFELLFPSLENNINSTNINTKKKSHNDFLDNYSAFIKKHPYEILAGGIGIITSIAVISCIVKNKKSNKKGKQKTIDNKNDFLYMDFKTPISYQEKSICPDLKELNDQNKSTYIDFKEPINDEENQHIDFKDSNMMQIILGTET